ncbi:2469_t:CDS:2, partial [Gigaspora rosea]
TKWAASECGLQWKRENKTKAIRECDLVFPKVLKDILVDLVQKGFKDAVLTKTCLNCPKGYTCRYVHEEPCKIYHSIS